MKKVLNLYAGIGGNRKLWEDVDVTAVEIDKQISKIYQAFFPNDKVIITDAHQYLLEHYDDEWDFVWSSPPCPTHSKIRNIAAVGSGQLNPVYPDMRLYQEIIFCQQMYYSNGCNFNGKWCVENVQPYYEPLIEPQRVGRHAIWTNFKVNTFNLKISVPIGNRGNKLVKELQTYHDFNLENYDMHIRKRVTLLRNCVNPKIGKHIFDCAFKKQQVKLDIG